MMHCVAFSESQDLGGVLGNIAGVADPSVRVQGDDIVVPAQVNQIFGALACAGASATQVRLISPSLRQVNPYEINPCILALVPPAELPLQLHEASPMPLAYNEALNAQLNSNPAAAEQATVVVFLTDKAIAPVTGKIYHARFTINVALVAGAWANAAIAFDDDLPSGVYRCVGSNLVCATAVAARWYPVGASWRPGFPIAQLASGHMDQKFRNGALGEWFSFDQVQPPTIDVLSSAAAAAADYVGVMDLIPA